MIDCQKGFTLIELMVALAIMAILGAIITPVLIHSVDRARLQSDIQSARILENALELYRIEQTGSPGSQIGAILEALKTDGYIQTDSAPQTPNAAWALHNNQIVLNIGGCENKIKEIAAQLSAQDSRWIYGVS